MDVIEKNCCSEKKRSFSHLEQPIMEWIARIFHVYYRNHSLSVYIERVYASHKLWEIILISRDIK